MSNIILLLPFGLGDHIICHGIIRAYCRKYDKVATFVMPHNYPSMAFMYRDLKNLEIIKGDKSFAKKFITANMSTLEHLGYDEVKIIGFQNFDRQSGVLFEKQEYQMAQVDLSEKWDNFYVERNSATEQILFDKANLSRDYVFLHEDISRNYTINRKLINKNYAIFTPKQELTDNIFDYCTIIEKAKEIHVIDSSFMFLIDCLKYESSEQKLYVHRYARENEEWKLPILKKNWRILNPSFLKKVNWKFSRTVQNIIHAVKNRHATTLNV